ncbi:hypothetical protein ACOSQ3_016195 [Xanthoceras sorbifolium]
MVDIMLNLSENFVQPAIPRFDGHYNHWSMLMENLLRTNIGRCIDKCTEDRIRRTKAKGFEGKELSFSGN